MPTLSALRANPHFAPLFAYVHVLFWPILCWQINRFYTWAAREGIRDALYTINLWGFLTVVRLGDRHDPAAYKPLARTFRPLTEAGWESSVPACLEVNTRLIPPRIRGGCGSPQSGLPEGAPAPSTLNTS
ncbi:hypothetical protein [Hyphomonas sp.]|uniref:hypothetical protein n=1 Tax=Hyphomonas sp. TaxID=87 RepID=UPI00391C8F96